MDRTFIERLANDLRKCGIDVWYDKWCLDVGDALTQKISEGINGSQYMLAVISHNSLNSKWVRPEFSAGMIKELERDRVFVLPAISLLNAESLK